MYPLGDRRCWLRGSKGNKSDVSGGFRGLSQELGTSLRSFQPSCVITVNSLEGSYPVTEALASPAGAGLVGGGRQCSCGLTGPPVTGARPSEV